MTFFFSFFSYKFVEPIRYNKSLLKIFPNIIKGTTALIVILFFVIQLNEIKLRNLVYDLILKTNNFATIYNLNKKSISNRKLAKWELDVDHCSKKEESFKRSTYLNCIKSDASNNDLFFLVGDSYGEHFINTLANITSIKNLYYARLDNENFESDIDLDNTHNLFNNYLNTSINFKKNKTVIISISYPNDLNHIKIQTFLSKFKNNEKFIFIAPHKVFNIRDECKTLNDNLVLNCIASNNIEQNSKIIKVIEKLDARKNIFIYDFKDKFCKKEICYSYLIEKDKFVFSDNFSHLTKEFAEFLSKDFEKFLDKNIFK
tara:strand:- start:696 stop:1643 length:948 start_codon:yes stop_codon:yes gene_type:complete